MKPGAVIPDRRTNKRYLEAENDDTVTEDSIQSA